MKMSRLLRLAVLLAVPILAPPARAATFKWANNGDTGSMDPYTRQETVQLSFLGNIYEPMARRVANQNRLTARQTDRTRAD